MKIVHIAPNAPYNEGWGYQENLLTKYQAKMGHDVTLIIKNQKHEDGKVVKTPLEDYVSPNGFRIIRLQNYKLKIFPILTKMSVFDYLKDIKPDFVFYHGLVSATIFDVIKYKKKINPNCIIVQDNHLDYYNSNIKKGIKSWLFKSAYVTMFFMTKKHISKVYGVTPWRKKYAESFFKVPPKMTDVLIMGADDEHIDFVNRDSIKKEIRDKYDVKDEDFLIVTGGKIDKAKNIHLLMQAVNECDNVKLLIFGNVSEDIKEKFNENISDKMIFIGWIDGSKVYDYFMAGDLVFFPGTHSVLWEQACASKVPCVFEKWEGMDHVNNGGNGDFIADVTVESLKEKIEELKFTPKYFKMKETALSDKTDIYLYSNIAERSLECFDKDADRQIHN